MSARNELIPSQKLLKTFSFLSIALLLLFVSTGVYAQPSVEINNQDVGSWFSRNWMWVVGAVILLLLIVLLSGKSRKGIRKTTTVVKDNYGNVKSVTTTEEKP